VGLSPHGGGRGWGAGSPRNCGAAIADAWRERRGLERSGAPRPSTGVSHLHRCRVPLDDRDARQIRAPLAAIVGPGGAAMMGATFRTLRIADRLVVQRVGRCICLPLRLQLFLPIAFGAERRCG